MSAVKFNPNSTHALRTDNVGFAAKSARLRGERAELKKQVKAGRVTLRDVILYPAAHTEGVLLWDVLLWGHKFGHRKLRDLNVKAMRHHHNLATTLGATSPRTREWLAEEVQR